MATHEENRWPRRGLSMAAYGEIPMAAVIGHDQGDNAQPRGRFRTKAPLAGTEGLRSTTQAVCADSLPGDR
jgi:hypothetical protein